MPDNPNLLPCVTFPSYDCTLDPPMRAPADALWEVSRCIGAFVCSNCPQASTSASMWSPGIAILPWKTRAIFTCLCVPPWHWRGQHAGSCLPECSCALESRTTSRRSRAMACAGTTRFSVPSRALLVPITLARLYPFWIWSIVN